MVNQLMPSLEHLQPLQVLVAGALSCMRPQPKLLASVWCDCWISGCVAHVTHPNSQLFAALVWGDRIRVTNCLALPAQL